MYWARVVVCHDNSIAGMAFIITIAMSFLAQHLSDGKILNLDMIGSVVR